MDWRDLDRPIVLIAFEGWNDAANAATDALDHLCDTYPSEVVEELDCEEYYDYQVTRPRVEVTAAGRQIVWPGVQLRVVHHNDGDLVLISGPEPNIKWRSFCATLLEVIAQIAPRQIVFLGAMLADLPHSRPFAISGSGVELMPSQLDDSDYEGPTGIVGVLYDACRRLKTYRTVSLWVSVPHYTAAPPNPKATLTLLMRLENAIGETLQLGALPEQASVWEQEVDQLVADDPELSDYVSVLESQADAAELINGAGETLAAELEQYLYRHKDD